MINQFIWFQKLYSFDISNKNIAIIYLFFMCNCIFISIIPMIQEIQIENVTNIGLKVNKTL